MGDRPGGVEAGSRAPRPLRSASPPWPGLCAEPVPPLPGATDKRRTREEKGRSAWRPRGGQHAQEAELSAQPLTCQTCQDRADGAGPHSARDGVDGCVSQSAPET